MNQAQLAVPAAAAGGTCDLDASLASLSGLLSGPLAGIAGCGRTVGPMGQLQATMGSTATLMSGLSGLLDGQDNAVKGTIKSVLYGGYGS